MYHIQFIQVSPVMSQPITTKYLGMQIQKQQPVGISACYTVIGFKPNKTLLLVY